MTNVDVESKASSNLAAFRLHPSDFSFLKTECHVIGSEDTSLKLSIFQCIVVTERCLDLEKELIELPIH